MMFNRTDKIVFLTAFILLAYLFSLLIHSNTEYDNACEELGFETGMFRMGMSYCEDTEGNLHYAKIECERWYWERCSAKLISVGDVRVR